MNQPEERFRLEIQTTIRKETQQGGYSGEALTIREEIQLPTVQHFLECAKIIGQFHDLAQDIKKGQQ